MWQLVLKGLVSGVLVVAASEAARWSSALGAVLASLPLVSILAFVWLYRDTGSVEAVGDLSTAILWVLVPSALLFVVLPVLLRRGVDFYVALPVACGVMVVAYAAFVLVMRRFGVAP